MVVFRKIHKAKLPTQVRALPVCVLVNAYRLQLVTEADRYKELLNRESRAAHRSLIEPTPQSTLPAIRTYSSPQQQTPTSPSTSRLKTKRSKTSVEKPKVKKPSKTYEKSSQDIFEFHGGSDGEVDVTPRIELGSKAGKREKSEHFGLKKAARTQVSQDEGVMGRPVTSSEGDTELLSTEPQPYGVSSAGERDVSPRSSMPPPGSKFTSFVKSQRSETSTMPPTTNIVPSKLDTENVNFPAEATYFETQPDTRKPKPTEGSRNGSNDERSQLLSQHVRSDSISLKNGMKPINQQPTEEPAPSSSASEISPSQIFTVRNTDQTSFVSRGLGSRLDDEQILPQVDSNLSTMANPVVLLPAFTDTELGQDELSLSVPEIFSRSPAKTTKSSKRKRDMDDKNVDELDADDYAIGIPKEHYQPRPSKRRSGGVNEEVFVPTDFSKRPESVAKGKRKTKRHKTTAFQELLPKDEDEDEDEEVKMMPDPRFEIPEKKPPYLSTERDQPDVEKSHNTDESRLKAQPEPKQAVVVNGQKKRGRPKKAATNLSDEIVLDEVEADHDQEDAETEEPTVSAMASRSRKMTKTTGPPKPIIHEQEGSNNNRDTTEEDSEDIPANILNENHGNIIASELVANQMPEVSPAKSKCPPETPRKSATPVPKGPDKHSPISSGKVAYRVGLSKRARIAPLLRIVRK